MDHVRTNAEKAPAQYLRIAQLVAPDGILPVSKSTIWAWVKAGAFPAPIKLSPRITVFDREEVLAFVSRQQTKVQVQSKRQD